MKSINIIKFIVNIPKKIGIILINFYQKNISPSFGKRCIYYPTCSEYAKEAISRYGFFKGWYLAIKRIFRCNPWGGSGYDPVP